MTPKKKTKAEQEETLNKEVRMDGVGEDPAIRALQEIPTGTNRQDLEIALALQQIIRGQQLQGEELSKLREKMDRMDQAAEKWETDRQRFINEIDAQADKLRVSEAKREQMMAVEGQRLAALTAKASAEAVSDRLRLEEAWAKEPKEVIVSGGEHKIINTGQGQEARLFPEVLIIRHKKWIFPPGEAVTVPKSVADQLRMRHRIQQETRERQAALRANLESGKLEAEMIRIDNKYKTSTERLGQ